MMKIQKTRAISQKKILNLTKNKRNKTNHFMLKCKKLLKLLKKIK